MSYARKKIVFDTSALIPVCLHPDREHARMFRTVVLDHDLFSSTSCLRELLAVLMRPKFDAWRPLAQRHAWFAMYRSAVTVVEPGEKITACRDAKDNQFLELAVAARADRIISSDVHLLEMNPYRNIEIIRLQDFKLRNG
jgi:putative PIN family toxin of toxin-antitoxin system